MTETEMSEDTRLVSVAHELLELVYGPSFPGRQELVRETLMKFTRDLARYFMEQRYGKQDS